MLDDCPACLRARDKDGRTPLEILSAHKVCANMLRAQMGSVPEARAPNDSWQDRIWSEMQYENRKFDKSDRGEKEGNIFLLVSSLEGMCVYGLMFSIVCVFVDTDVIGMVK